MFWKKVKVPVSNEIKEIDAVQLWRVEWISRYGEFHSHIRQEVEVFTSESQANEFATALRNAFALVKHTWGNKVTVEKAK